MGQEIRLRTLTKIFYIKIICPNFLILLCSITNFSGGTTQQYRAIAKGCGKNVGAKYFRFDWVQEGLI